MRGTPEPAQRLWKPRSKGINVFPAVLDRTDIRLQGQSVPVHPFHYRGVDRVHGVDQERLGLEGTLGRSRESQETHPWTSGGPRRRTGSPLTTGFPEASRPRRPGPKRSRRLRGGERVGPTLESGEGEVVEDVGETGP